MPNWVVFKGKYEFATLERDAAGNVKWRNAMLTNLTGYYSGSFLPACVFYKIAGCHTIARYIHVEANPALVLTHLDALYGSPTSDLSGKAPGECVP